MATAKKAAPAKKATLKKSAKKKSNGKGGVREGAGAYQIVPNKVRKTIDIPEEEANKILEHGSDISSYMRIATYNQMVKDKLITVERRDALKNWKKKVA